MDERDPLHRILLKPVIDEHRLLRGFAGMILDPRFLVNELLPEVIARKSSEFFPRLSPNDPIITTEQIIASGENLAVALYDGRGNLLLATAALDRTAAGMSLPLRFIFSDWRLAVRSRFRTPEQAIREAVRYDMMFSIVMVTLLVFAVILTMRTALKEMEVSRMKADFVANVSHELRTPLASISAFGEFLRLGWIRDPEQMKQTGHYIEAESRRLTQLVNNILDVSNIESTVKRLRFERVDLREVVDDVVNIADVQYVREAPLLRVDAPADPLPAVRADREAITQGLLNLIDNAVKFSAPPAEVLIELRRRGDRVAVSVIDRGRGIPPEEQKKIFDRFYRVGDSLVHDVKGSGLGLAIVKQMVDAHDGTISVESRLGHGSTFTILLPVSR